MSVPTVVLNEDTPAGTSYIRAGDDRIREFKTQVREILAVNHEFPSSGQGANVGRHKQMTLTEAADIGTGAVGIPILGAQTVVEPELCYTDEIDRDVILTDKGKIALQNGRIPNNTYLIGRNAADDGDVNILKVNASDILEFATFPITPSAAPDADYEVANKKFVDDSISGCVLGAANISEVLGAWDSATYSADTVYLAATDGFVVATTSREGAACGFIGLTDSSNPPTTVVCGNGHSDTGSSSYKSSFTMPVRKGDYWKVESQIGPVDVVRWIPLGA